MSDDRIKILHLTPHLGTGVGTVLLNYLAKVKTDARFVHSVACLDYANDLGQAAAKEHGFSLQDNFSQRPEELLKIISTVDIVLVHQWNYPMFYDFFVRHPLPAGRVIMWSHTTGAPAPNNFTEKLLRYPDKFVFTTPLSFDVKEVKNLINNLPDHFSAIWSTGGAERLQWIKPQAHQGFNVGYIGSLDPAKLHPDFLEICGQIDIPEAHFIVVGGPNDKSLELKNKAIDLGIADKFTFTGWVTEEEKWKYLALFDVFGYPLAQHHYGSSDQILQEAMGVGVAPVVFNNPMESLMVKNNECGLVAADAVEYIKAVEKLYHDQLLRQSLARNAKQYALANFSLDKMEKEWNELFTKVLLLPKTPKIWPLSKTITEITAKDVLLEALGEYGRPFADYCQAKNELEKKQAMEQIKDLAKLVNWQSASKGTAHQYVKFFPEDEYLMQWDLWTK